MTEPVGLGTVLAVGMPLLVFGMSAAVDWEDTRDNPMSWLPLCLKVIVGVALAFAVLTRRHHAWLVMLPHEERLRVVRLCGLDYRSATLSLRKPISVEYSLAGKDAWLFVVAHDGRAARVLPATHALLASDVGARVEAALAATSLK